MNGTSILFGFCQLVLTSTSFVTLDVYAYISGTWSSQYMLVLVWQGKKSILEDDNLRLCQKLILRRGKDIKVGS